MKTNRKTAFENHVSLYLLAATLLVSCAPKISSPSRTTVGAAPSPVRNETAISTATTPTEIVSASPTYPPAATAIPDSWSTYAAPGLHMQFRYPETWKAETATRYSGPDGYFEVSTSLYPASEFDSLITLCVLSANGNKPASFGAAPFITPWQGLSSQSEFVEGSGCTVTPSDSQSSRVSDQAVLFGRFPPPTDRSNLFILRTDAAHFGGILSTLQFSETITPTPHPVNIYNTPACALLLADPRVKTSHFAGLTIREYPLVNAGCDPYAHLDGFQARLQSLNLDNGARYDAERQRRADEANRVLEGFGYRLTGRILQLSNPPGSTAPNQISVFDLSKGNLLIATDLTQIGPISVNATGDDFILWVQDTFNSKPAIEIRRNSLRKLNWWENGFDSAWVGTDLVRFAYASTPLFPVGAASQAIVYRNDKVDYSLTIPEPGPAGNPVQWLWSWQNHWILEAGNVVVQDGVLQNPILGYDEMFAWHLVNAEPFYFFSNKNGYGVSYGGQALPVHYEDIIHGLLCCSSAAYSLDSSPAGAWFYARKNGIWYLVSILAE